MALNWMGFNQEDVPAYQAPQYQGYQPGALGTSYQDATMQQLSGRLSPSQIAALNKQFQTNLSQTNAGAFGMPVGAAQGQLGNLASQNALNYGLLGEQNIQTGQNAALGYMDFGQRQAGALNAFNQNNAANMYQSQLNAFESPYSQAGGGLLGTVLGYGLGEFASEAIPGALGGAWDTLFPKKVKV